MSNSDLPNDPWDSSLGNPLHPATQPNHLSLSLLSWNSPQSQHFVVYNVVSQRDAADLWPSQTPHVKDRQGIEVLVK